MLIQQDTKRKEESFAEYDAIKSYCETGTIPHDFTPFLLPSQSVGVSTTAVAVRIKYGRTFHLMIKYHDEAWAKEAAYSYAKAIKEGVQPQIGGLIHQLWQNITGKFGDAYEEGEILPNGPGNDF